MASYILILALVELCSRTSNVYMINKYTNKLITFYSREGFESTCSYRNITPFTLRLARTTDLRQSITYKTLTRFTYVTYGPVI